MQFMNIKCLDHINIKYIQALGLWKQIRGEYFKDPSDIQKAEKVDTVKLNGWTLVIIN